MSGIQGSCLCGNVTFIVDPPSLEQNEMGARISKETRKYRALGCFCTMCAKQAAGPFQLYFMAANTALHVKDKKYLKTYESSKDNKRSFCSNCGSSLFFEPINGTWIDISASACDSESYAKYVELLGYIYCEDSVQPGLPNQIQDKLPKYTVETDSSQL